MSNDQQVITEVVKLTPAPGDLIVLKHPGRLSASAKSGLREALGRWVRENGVRGTSCIVLDEGMDISVVSAEQLRRAGYIRTIAEAGSDE